eukprot:s1661_g3.t1
MCRVQILTETRQEVGTSMFAVGLQRVACTVVTWADLLDDPSEMALQAVSSSSWQGQANGYSAAPMSPEEFALFLRSQGNAPADETRGRTLQLPRAVVGSAGMSLREIFKVRRLTLILYNLPVLDS